MQPDPLLLDIPDEAPHAPDPADYLDDDGNLMIEGLVFPPKEILLDIDTTMSAWREVAWLLPEAPLFPVDQFAEMVGLSTPMPSISPTGVS